MRLRNTTEQFKGQFNRAIQKSNSKEQFKRASQKSYRAATKQRF
jgi:hypothetical protein